MMKTYASVIDGVVQEIVLPMVYVEDDVNDPRLYKSGDEIPIDQRYTPEFVATLVEITNVVPAPNQNWTYDGSAFSEPTPVPVDHQADNTAMRDSLMATAIAATYGMSDAFVAGLLDDADTATFKAWAKYKLALSKVDLTQAAPTWPTQPA